MASLKVELHVEMEDGTEFDVAADQRDYASWEAQPFGTSTVDIETKPVLATRFLAYSALLRKGYTKSWETFQTQCVDVSSKETESPKAGKRAAQEEA